MDAEEVSDPIVAAMGDAGLVNDISLLGEETAEADVEDVTPTALFQDPEDTGGAPAANGAGNDVTTGDEAAATPNQGDAGRAIADNGDVTTGDEAAAMANHDTDGINDTEFDEMVKMCIVMGDETKNEPSPCVPLLLEWKDLDYGSIAVMEEADKDKLVTLYLMSFVKQRFISADIPFNIRNVTCIGEESYQLHYGMFPGTIGRCDWQDLPPSCTNGLFRIFCLLKCITILRYFLPFHTHHLLQHDTVGIRSWKRTGPPAVWPHPH